MLQHFISKFACKLLSIYAIFTPLFSVQGLLQLSTSAGFAIGPTIGGGLQEVCTYMYIHQAAVKLT